MELAQELFLALRDLRHEVDDMAKRVGWSGNNARIRADSAINRYLVETQPSSAASVAMISDAAKHAPVADNSGGTFSVRSSSCSTCMRDTVGPLFDGCMTPNCPRGFGPCL